MRAAPSRSPEASPATMATRRLMRRPRPADCRRPSPHDAPAGGGEEVDDGPDLRRRSRLRLEFRLRLGERETGAVEGLVGALERRQRLRAEPAPLQALR